MYELFYSLIVIRAEKNAAAVRVTLPSYAVSLLQADALTGDNGGARGVDSSINNLFNELMAKVLGPYWEKQLFDLSEIVCVEV